MVECVVDGRRASTWLGWRTTGSGGGEYREWAVGVTSQGVGGRRPLQVGGAHHGRGRAGGARRRQGQRPAE
jgi:hypothetical protein